MLLYNITKHTQEAEHDAQNPILPGYRHYVR